MDGGQAIFLHHFLGNEDGVLKVVTVPGHERDAHVLPQCQLTQIHGRTVGQNVTTGDHVTLTHDGTLVDTGILVRTGVLGQVVDIHTRITRFGFLVVDTNHDTGRVDTLNHTATTGRDTDTGVLRYRTLYTGTYQRYLGTQGRNCLALHVRTHQCPVGVIMLQERDQGCRDRYNLARRYIHEVNALRRSNGKFVLVANGNQLVGQTLGLLVHGGAGLGDDVVALFNCRQVNHFIGNHAVLDLPVRTLEEAVGIGTGVSRQRVNQTDVRTFRRLDRTHTTVMSRVHVTDLKSGALTGQTTWAQRRDTTLVRDLGQRVVLVHELGQLTGAEEFLNSGSHRLGVDQILRHQAFAFSKTQTLTDRTLNPHQTDAELVFGHLADTANSTVTQVIDVIHITLAVTDIDQGLEDVDDVFVGQRAFTCALFTAQTTVQLHPANGRQIVPLFGEEQVVEQILSRLLGGRLARAHHPVDLNQRFKRRAGRIDTQGVRHKRTAVQVVGVKGFDFLHASVEDLGNQLFGQLRVTLNQHFTGSLINHVLRQYTAVQVLGWHLQLVDTGLFKLLNMAGGNPAAFLDNHVTVIVLDVEGRDVTTQTARHQLQLAHFGAQAELTGFEEHLEHLLGGIAHRTQKD